MKPMLKGLSIFRISVVRIAFGYTILFFLAAVILSGFIYISSTEQLSRQTDETINAETQGLAEQYASGGISRLARTIRGRSSRPGAGLYFVGNKSGAYIVGNLKNLPKNVDAADGWIDFTINQSLELENGKDITLQHAARARVFHLPEGAILLVGRDIQSIRDIEFTLRRMLIWGLVATLFLGGIGGVFVGHRMLVRVNNTSLAANEISVGDLTGRLPLSGRDDELDRLSATFNLMLERIEHLMIGMSEVSDNVAHDLRSPLARVRAEAENAISSAKTLDEAKDALAAIIKEIDRLLGVFTSLLSIARLEAGVKHEPFQTIDIGAMLTDLAELYEPSATEAGVAFKTDFEAGILAAADRTLLSQSVANLIENALRYGRDEVSITLRRGTGAYEITVSDRGPGVPDDKKAVVFERFARLDSQRTTSGSGLGLSLVRAIAIAHGGSVTLSDNHPGLSATIRLPIT